MKIFKTAEPPKPLTGAQKIRATEQAIELDEIKRAADFAREQEEFQRGEWRRNALETIKGRDKVAKTTDRVAMIQKYAPYVPLILVNLTAMVGQFSWAIEHLTQFGTSKSDLARIIAAFLFAITSESIALVLQYHANRALRNRDSAASLYLAAFGVAALVAYVNYSHYAVPVHDQLVPNPTPMAVISALCSVVSPWLWRIDSRAKHRVELRANGEIDSRAVRLSLARKIFHPIRSIGVISLAAWTGESNPADAVAQWEAHRDKIRARKIEAAKQPTEAGPVEIEVEQIMTPKRQKLSRTKLANGADYRDHPLYPKGVEIFQLSKAGPGRPLSQRDLAHQLGMKNRALATKIIKDVNTGDVKINNSVPATP